MDEQLARAIGERVRFHRTAGKRTKTAVAGLSGITADYLYQIERGMKLPTIPVLTRLAGVLGVSVAELLGQQPATSIRSANTVAGETIYRALTEPVPNLWRSALGYRVARTGSAGLAGLANVSAALHPARRWATAAHR